MAINIPGANPADSAAAAAESGKFESAAGQLIADLNQFRSSTPETPVSSDRS